MPNYATLTASTHYIDAGSHASIDDLPSADATYELWFRVDSVANTPNLITKHLIGTGTIIGLVAGRQVTVSISFDTPHAVTHNISAGLTLNEWHHLAITWDASTYTSEAFLDGVSYGSQAEGAGAITTDASYTMYVGNSSANSGSYADDIGWVRISDTIRYTSNFVPNARNDPPSNDANTVRLFAVDEGTGTTIGDDSSNAQNATLSGGWAFQSNVESATMFLAELQLMTVTGVTRHYDYPPTSLNAADLPAAFPLMPGSGLGGPVVSCLGRNVSRTMDYVIAVEAVGRDTQQPNYETTVYYAEQLENAITALLESQGGNLADFINFDIVTGSVQEVAGHEFWAVVATITAAGIPL